MKTTDMAAMAAALSVEVGGRERELDALMARIAGCFARVDARATARDAVDGLLADLPRKNCWSLAEYAGHDSPDRLQHLLSRASWDDAAVRAETAAYVADNLTAGVDPELVTLVFDETGDAKKGPCTVGVQRQHSGTCGRIENCQIAVYATLATPAGHAFVDVELYLPRSWTEDPERLAAAGVPEDVEFATKPQLALAMTDRVLAAGILPEPGKAWLAADEAYGDNRQLRQELEQRDLNYVMAVSRDTQIPTPTGKMRADTLARTIPSSGWQILSAGDGSKGKRLYAWAYTSITDPSDPDSGHHRWLLIRRNPHTSELAYYLCHATGPVSLRTLVRVAGTRWRIEETFQASKGCAGLDEHQVRTWTSWHRWTTLAMLAHAFLAITAAHARSQPARHHPTDPEQHLIPLTCNEIRHLKAALTRPHHSLDHIAHWSLFRRQHQHRAKLCHYNKRQQRDLRL